jgi:4-hydroxy-3-methylbut-2-en-1-yl diphosphate reductase
MSIKSAVNRRGFGLKDAIQPQLTESYRSSFITQIREGGHKFCSGRMTILLAREFGFCYGVDRAVDLAYETRKRFPDKDIYLTSEIIHNPRVNTKLKEMGIRFLAPASTGDNGGGSYDPFASIAQDDVVLIPAFGSSTPELEKLKAIGCLLVDTTCGSVMAVWRRVEQYGKDGFTALIHGQYDHEETKATSSRVSMYPGGKYVVIRDQAEGQMICDFIEGRLSADVIMEKFGQAASDGFDPNQDLVRIGCANQTTMLSSESLEIASQIEAAMTRQFGADKAHLHFRHFDTICSATQDRQDAVLELVKSNLDLMLVVGGYNSSNTGHLCEIASQYCPAYHVQDADEIYSRDQIRHKPPFVKEPSLTTKWLPPGTLTIGVTAGASTPNRVVEEVILKVCELGS